MMPAWEARCLRWLRVPPEPQPPSGSPGSLQVFRAGRNYLRLRLIVWIGAQAGAVFGVLASVCFIREMEIQHELEPIRQARAAAQPDAPAPSALDDLSVAAERGTLHRWLYTVAPPWLKELPRRIPWQAIFWMKLGESIAVVVFVVQLGGSFLAVFLDYRWRWYMVTDRSLRLRWGVFNIQETTMSFANLQQVALHQGPLQRLLGLSDVEVESAGGGGGKSDEHDGDSMHRSVFHAVENGAEIRDIILARLRRFREAGLGDPDDAHRGSGPGEVEPPRDDAAAVQAARVVLAEIQAWRKSLRD